MKKIKQLIKQFLCNHNGRLQIEKINNTLFAKCKYCSKPLPQLPEQWQQIKTWENYKLKAK